MIRTLVSCGIFTHALTARGDVVDVIALREAGRPQVFESEGVKVIGVQSREVNEQSRFAYLLRLILFFLRTMAVLSWRHLRVRYDVIHVHSVPDFLVFTALLPKLMGAKIVLDIHDLSRTLCQQVCDGPSVRNVQATSRRRGRPFDLSIT